MAFDQGAYANRYTRDNYDTIRALVPKGRKADIQAAADRRGLTVSQLIVQALEGQYGLDLSRP